MESGLANGRRQMLKPDQMKDAGSKAAEGGAGGMKMLDQAEENTRQAFAAMRAAAKAGDLSELMRIQADFIREQSSRSVAQAREIGEMIAQFGREAMANVTGKGEDGKK